MGERLEFDGFYAAEFQRVFKAVLATSRSPELAQDVTQEAFKRAFVRWGRLADKPWAGGWVMTTALNLVRKERKTLVHTELQLRDVEAIDQASDLHLVEVLRRLPHRQRTAALLYYVADLPVHEVAQAMDVADGTVKALLSQAREKLRQALGDGDG